MAEILLIVHERIGTWARQFRPRAAAWGVRLVETRSRDDLSASVRQAVCPVIVCDLGDRPRAMLDDLDHALQAEPTALAIVIDPSDSPGLPLVARQLGAAHVIGGDVPPPVLLALLARWLPLARRRAESDGWSPSPAPDPQGWPGLVGADSEP